MKHNILSLLCIFLIVLSFVGIASAEEFAGVSEFTSEYESLNVDEKKKLAEASDQWFKDHTFNVVVTTVYSAKSVDSKNAELYIEETYYSTDSGFREMFGTDSLTSDYKFQVETTDNQIYFEGKVFSMKDVSKNIYETETKQLVITTESDPYNWQAYGYSYPKYLWKLVDGSYVRTDPINLVWENMTAQSVKNRILTNQPSWVGAVAEYNYVLWDPSVNSYIQSNSVASSYSRTTGGYHARIYGLGQGDVVGAAHQDSPVVRTSYPYTYTGHQIVNFENAESLIASFFSPSYYNYTVYSNNLSLSNSGYFEQGGGYPSVYNNGKATRIIYR